MDAQAIRGAGFSQAKVAALRDLAAKTLDGTVPTGAIVRKLDDEAIIERLIAVRGIGRWTVEMLLIFQLGRPDVLPVDDFGVRNGFRIAYGLRSMPTPKEILRSRGTLETLSHGRSLVSLAGGRSREGSSRRLRSRRIEVAQWPIRKNDSIPMSQAIFMSMRPASTATLAGSWRRRVSRKSVDFSAVTQQPTDEGHIHQAYQALLACPVGSIGTEHSDQLRMKEAMASFPLQLEDGGVYYCGFNSEKSFGANSFFIEHPDGNWLIDSPALSQASRRGL